MVASSKVNSGCGEKYAICCTYERGEWTPYTDDTKKISILINTIEGKRKYPKGL